VRASRENLCRRASVDYQAVLVSVWDCLRQRVPRGVLIIGGNRAQAPVDALVDQLRKERVIDARKLSRFAAGAVIVSARRARQGHRRWPDAIVLVENRDDETVKARIQALSQHLSVRTVALVGVGAAAGVAGAELAGLVPSPAGSSTTVTTHSVSDLTASLPHVPPGKPGALTRAWSNLAVGTKIAIAAGTAAVAAGVGVIVPIIVDGSSVEFAQATTVSVSNDPKYQADHSFYPLGPPKDAKVLLGPPTQAGKGADKQTEYVSRKVSVQLDGVGKPVNLGRAILPTSLPDQASHNGRTVVAEIQQKAAKLPIAGMPSGIYCYVKPDRSKVVAGWRYTGDPVTLRVLFLVVTKAGAVTGTQIVVDIEGRAKRQPLPTTPDGYQFGQKCPEYDDAAVVFYSPAP